MPHLAARAVPAALLTLLLATAPAQAAQDSRARDLRTNRAAADRALERAQEIAAGQGVRTGRELTPALAELFARRAALGPAGRAAARELMLRPTFGGAEQTADSGRFRVHWTNTTDDAPPQADTSPNNGRPDYIDRMLESFAQSETHQHVALGWAFPPSDGNEGGNGLTDVYVKDLPNGLYGTATPESTSSGVASYLTMDDDYSATEFPSYGGNFLPPLQVTAAHEYNHVLQFGYDPIQDRWMFESTATWMEEKVFPAVNDYHQYMTSWVGLPAQALPITEAANEKMYGSAIWNHWLDGRFGAAAIRRAWEVSAAGGSFAPGAYDQAIREAGGGGFAPELIEFSAATVEWDAANSGIFEGALFPADMARTGTLPLNGQVGPLPIDHTAFTLLDVPRSTASSLELIGSFPAGTAGGIALVGFDGANLTKALTVFAANGQATATLPDPGRFTRVTAVGVNADVTHGTFIPPPTNDWDWVRDDQALTLSVAERNAAPPPPPPPPPVVPATSPLKVRTGKLPRLGRLARTGILAIIAEVTGPGRLRARATVDKATAKRLKVGRRTTTVGTGAKTVTKAGKATLRIKLTKKARKGLRRQRRTLRIRVRTTFTPSNGGAVTRTVSLFLRP